MEENRTFCKYNLRPLALQMFFILLFLLNAWIFCLKDSHFFEILGKIKQKQHKNVKWMETSDQYLVNTATVTLCPQMYVRKH